MVSRRGVRAGSFSRAMIALALSCNPSLLLADEPTTALDATVQIQVLLLIRELQRELDLGVIFVTHDIGVAVEVSDRIGVMSARPGRIIDTVETGWPRERDSRIIEQTAFGSITSRLWKSLREESLKTIGRAATA